MLVALLAGALALAAPVFNGTGALQRLETCPYTVGGPSVSSRSATIQLIEFGDIHFEQDCDQAEARGPGLLNLTDLGETPLVPGEMASIKATFSSCTLAWPSRYGEVFLDFRREG
jgi:hypothetical protein